MRRKNQGEENEMVCKEEGKLRKRVMNLVKMRKLTDAQKLIKTEIETEPWGRDAQAKVCGVLLQVV